MAGSLRHVRLTFQVFCLLISPCKRAAVLSRQQRNYWHGGRWSRSGVGEHGSAQVGGADCPYDPAIHGEREDADVTSSTPVRGQPALRRHDRLYSLSTSGLACVRGTPLSPPSPAPLGPSNWWAGWQLQGHCHRVTHDIKFPYRPSTSLGGAVGASGGAPASGRRRGYGLGLGH
jgi:hypothetical protein